MAMSMGSIIPRVYTHRDSCAIIKHKNKHVSQLNAFLWAMHIHLFDFCILIGSADIPIGAMDQCQLVMKFTQHRGIGVWFTRLKLMGTTLCHAILVTYLLMEDQ